MEAGEALPTYGRYPQRMLTEAGTGMQAEEPGVLSDLQARLDELLEGVSPVVMLDAGAGRRRAIPVAGERYVVGVDISAQEIATNQDVDEAIVGDIQTCDLGSGRFDAVICWDVLEHVREPPRALLNFQRALKPGGVMIVAVPHAASVKGLVTRLTPFWFHGWVRRRFDAGSATEPFPTFMSPTIKPSRLVAFAREQGMTVEFLAEYEAWQQKKLRARLRVTGRAFGLVRLAVGALSLGGVTFGSTDAIVVMRKQG